MSRRANLLDPGALESGRKPADPCDNTRSSSEENSMPHDFVALPAQTTICVWKMQYHFTRSWSAARKPDCFAPFLMRASVILESCVVVGGRSDDGRECGY